MSKALVKDVVARLIAKVKPSIVQLNKNTEDIKVLKAGGGSGGGLTWKDITATYRTNTPITGTLCRITVEGNALLGTISAVGVSSIMALNLGGAFVLNSDHWEPTKNYISSTMIDFTGAETGTTRTRSITKFEVLV